MIKASGDMNLAVRIHLNCWEFILVGLECQYKQKGAVQTEPPLNDVASKMPLIICLHGRKKHKHPRSHQKK
jgi:hypothetical protein